MDSANIDPSVPLPPCSVSARGRRHPGWVRTAAVVAAIALAGACSDDDGTATADADDVETTAEQGGSADGATGDIADEAARISTAAADGLVWPGSDTPSGPNDWVEVGDEWFGPTEAVTPPEDQLVVFLSCAAGSPCEEGANLGAQIVKDELGWEAEVLNANGTPEGFQTTFDSAIALKPDLIIAIAFADEVVGANIARARDAGIATVAIAVEENNPADPYDAYVSYMTNTTFELLAYALVEETGGEANMLLINDSSFPNLVTGQDAFAAVAEAGGIETTDVEWTVSDGLDPVRASSIVQAALRSNPDTTHIVLPYSIGLTNVIDAVRTSGQQVEVVSKDTDTVSIGTVAKGGAAFTGGVSVIWGTWAAIDQGIRAMTGADVLPADQLGLALRLYNPDNAPDDGSTDFTEFFDFEAQYRELWGL